MRGKWRHKSLTASLLGAGLCVVGLALQCGRCADGGTTQATPSGGETQELRAFVGSWTSWTHPLLRPARPGSPGVMQMAAHAGSRWVAALVPGGHLRIWELAQHGELGALVWRTPADGDVASAIAWLGDRLVFGELPGINNWGDFYDVYPPQPPAYDKYDEYLAHHSRTVAVDPKTGARAVIIGDGAGTAVSDPLGEHLVLCNATYTDDFVDHSWERADVQIHDPRTGLHVRGFRPEIAQSLRGSGALSVQREPRALARSGDWVGFWALGWGEDRELPDEYRATPQPAVVTISLDGDVHDLSDGYKRRYQDGYIGLPATTTEPDGQPAIGFMLTRSRGMPYRLAFHRPTGELLREYDFGLRWGCLRDATGYDGQWTPLTVTPDGHWLLLHAVWAGVCPPTRGDPCCIWMWHLDRRVALPVARLHGITGSFGWLHDEYLILEVQAQNETGREYGVLHVPWKTLANELAEPD